MSRRRGRVRVSYEVLKERLRLKGRVADIVQDAEDRAGRKVSIIVESKELPAVPEGAEPPDVDLPEAS